MTLTTCRPRRPPGRLRAPRISRRDWERILINRLKTEIEPFRTSLVCGCTLIGWFGDEPLNDIIGHLVGWAMDPEHLATLGWPRYCMPWPWSPGEDLAVWRGGRLLAVVTLRLDGRADVRRFDR
jgi:hypothetical protein